jgi:hypothetical protein
MVEEHIMRKYIERYTGALLWIPGSGNPEHKGKNYYETLHATVTAHYRSNGVEIEPVAAFMAVKDAIAELAEHFLNSGEAFHALQPTRRSSG